MKLFYPPISYLLFLIYIFGPVGIQAEESSCSTNSLNKGVCQPLPPLASPTPLVPGDEVVSPTSGKSQRVWSTQGQVVPSDNRRNKRHSGRAEIDIDDVDVNVNWVKEKPHTKKGP